jgi:hypothetical protein
VCDRHVRSVCRTCRPADYLLFYRYSLRELYALQTTIEQLLHATLLVPMSYVTGNVQDDVPLPGTTGPTAGSTRLVVSEVYKAHLEEAMRANDAALDRSDAVLPVPAFHPAALNVMVMQPPIAGSLQWSYAERARFFESAKRWTESAAKLLAPAAKHTAAAATLSASAGLRPASLEFRTASELLRAGRKFVWSDATPDEYE